jgi:hypothetical protein
MRNRTMAAALGLLLGTAACDETPASLPSPASVLLASESMALLVGDQAVIGAQVLDQDGRVMPGRLPVFVSTDPAIASVSATGAVRGMAPGAVEVSAAYGVSVARVRVTVSADRRSQVQLLEVLADTVVVDVRAGVKTVAVRALDGFGALVCPQLTLVTANVSVADVRAAGACRLQVEPRFAGETLVTASADERTDTFVVRVTSTGDVVFIAARPSTAEVVAGATVSYTVKVLDKALTPRVGHPVHLDPSVGVLSASTVTTGADGTATVQWTLPIQLGRWGQWHTIHYRTQLPNGTIAGSNEQVWVDGTSVAEIMLYLAVGSYNLNIQPVRTSSVTVPAGDVTIAAAALDPYGNVRRTHLTFTSSAAVTLWPCGDSLEAGIEHRCFNGGTGTTTTVTVTAPDGQWKSVQLVFAPR